MSTSRRKNLIRVMERAAIILTVLDIALFFGAVLPSSNLIKSEESRYANAHRLFQEQAARLAQLERYDAELPGAGEQIKGFLHDHVPPRRRGYSHASRLVRQLAEHSGLQLTAINYKLDSGTNAPLERLGMMMDVEGPFDGLLNFAHALETSSDFIVLRDLNFSSGERGTMTLRVSAELYLAP